MRNYVMVLAALGLAACSPRVPDSAAGVGFQDYNTYNSPPAVQPAAQGFSADAARAAIDNAEGRGAASGLTPTNQPLGALQPYGSQPGQPAQGNVIGSGAGARPRGNAPAGIVETTSEMVNVPGSAANAAGANTAGANTAGANTAGAGTVSDEQDFQAVKARETIESDKARIERNRAQYTVDQPTALPTRAGDAGPNIVAFAISTSHPVGTQMYKRSKLSLTNYNTACARYPSPDLAEEAFLAAGGPNKDRKGLDPDGDGYACAWNPVPFRAAVQN